MAAIPAFLVALGLAPWQPVAVAIFALALYVADSTMVSTRIYGGMLRIPMFVVLVACSSGRSDGSLGCTDRLAIAAAARWSFAISSAAATGVICALAGRVRVFLIIPLRRGA